MDKPKDTTTKKFSNEMNDFSRLTGARVEMLRRFINRTAKDARAETWDKIYASLKPFLVGEGAENRDAPPPRLGGGYRRHSELVAMTSNQKVLLDEYAMLSDSARATAEEALRTASGNAPATDYQSLSAEENHIMGYFVALPEDEAEKQLLEITRIATAELHKLRQELL